MTYGSIVQESEMFKQFGESELAKEPEINMYVLNINGKPVALVQNPTNYDNPKETPLSGIFPNAPQDEIGQLEIQISHKGREVISYLCGQDTYVSFSEKEKAFWNDSRYGIISLDPNDEETTGKVEKLLDYKNMRIIRAPDSIGEAEKIYHTLIPDNEYGAHHFVSTLAELGLKPNQVTTDVLDGYIEVNAEGDREVGSDKPISNFIADFLISGKFQNVRLNLRDTGIVSGDVKTMWSHRDVDFVKIDDWLPDRMIYSDSRPRELYVDVTDTKVEATDGKTIYDNGKFIEGLTREKTESIIFDALNRSEGDSTNALKDCVRVLEMHEDYDPKRVGPIIREFFGDGYIQI